MVNKNVIAVDGGRQSVTATSHTFPGGGALIFRDYTVYHNDLYVLGSEGFGGVGPTDPSTGLVSGGDGSAVGVPVAISGPLGAGGLTPSTPVINGDYWFAGWGLGTGGFLAGLVIWASGNGEWKWRASSPGFSTVFLERGEIPEPQSSPFDNTVSQFIGITFNSSTFVYTFYLNGIVLNTFNGAAGTTYNPAGWAIGQSTGAPLTLDEIAWGPGLLPGSVFANLYSLRNDWAAYTIAVKALNPAAAFHLGDGGSGTLHGPATAVVIPGSIKIDQVNTTIIRAKTQSVTATGHTGP